VNSGVAVLDGTANWLAAALVLTVSRKNTVTMTAVKD
jgi:hypothetical protein